MKNRALIQARKKKGYTQERLAELLGCKKSTVSNWENGHSTPSLTDAFRVAELLESDVNDLFSGLKVQETYTNQPTAREATSA